MLELATAHARACAQRLLTQAFAGSTTSRWTREHARRVLDEVDVPQRRLLSALAQSDGDLPVAAVLAAVGDDRASLRGLTGPVIKAMQRLQLRRVLPPELERPQRTHADVHGRGHHVARSMSMTPDVRAAFRAALDEG